MPKRGFRASSIIVIVVVSIAALMLIGLGVAPFFVSKSLYTAYIEKQIEGIVDARVEIEKIHFQFIPYPRFTVRGLTIISTNESSKNQVILAIDKLKGEPSVSGLLKGMIETDIEAGGLNTIIGDIKVDDANFSTKRNSFTMRGHVISPSVNLNRLPFGLDGNLSFNRLNREIKLQISRAQISSVDITGTVAIDRGVNPQSFDAHLVSPNLDRKIVDFFDPLLPFHFDSNFIWDGQIAVDLSLKGSSNNFALSSRLDLSRAGIVFEDILKKDPGVFLKSSVSLSVSPENIAVDQVEINLGQENIKISGDVQRNDNYTFKASVLGDGLGSSTVGSIFPWFIFLESFEGLNLESDVSGEIFGSAPFNVKGNFTSGKIKIMDTDFEDVEGAFERFSEGLKFPYIKGKLSNASVSGSGSVMFDDEELTSFEAVIEHADISSFKILSGAISGDSKMVVKLESKIVNQETGEKDIKASGSVVASDASFTKKGINQFFGETTWKDISEVLQAELNAFAEEKLSTVDSSVKDLKATFELSNGKLSVSSLDFLNVDYKASLEITMDELGVVSGKGFIAPSKPISSKLLPESIQKSVFDKKGDFLLPTIIGGKLPDFIVLFDRTQFENIFRGKTKPEKKVEPAKTMQAKETQPKSKQKKIKKREEYYQQTEEDILKVIIGK